jgi:hypothetical protein
MHYPDFSKYKPARNHTLKPFVFEEVLTIGWLENGQDYSQGEVEKAIVDKLKTLLASPKTNINKTRGNHECDFCEACEDGFRTISVPHYQILLPLGFSELWIPTKSEIIYVAPSLIYHYITEHEYKPPAAFLEAIVDFKLDSNWDGERKYLFLVDEYRKRIVLD